MGGSNYAETTTETKPEEAKAAKQPVLMTAELLSKLADDYLTPTLNELHKAVAALDALAAERSQAIAEVSNLVEWRQAREGVESQVTQIGLTAAKLSAQFGLLTKI